MALVRRDIVNETDIEVVGHRAIDQIQEAAELDGPVLIGHVGDHLTRGDIEAGVER